MKVRKAMLFTLMSAGASVALAGSAFAMAPAQTKAGLEVGGEAGFGLSNGNKYALAGDLDYGIKTGWLGSPYTAGVIDVLNVGRTESFSAGGLSFSGEGRATLVGLGVRQPLNVTGDVPVAFEGGVDFLSANGSAGGISRSTSSTGGFLGARATWAQHGSIGLTGMARYHFVSGGIYQFGLGLTGPINKGTGLFYQVDYYHTGGAQYSGMSSMTDTILVGVRFTAKP